MADIIKRVIVEVDSDTRKLQKGFKQVDKRVGLLTKGVKRLGGALAAAFGARALLRGFQQTLRSTEDLIKTAKGVGFTATEYERVSFAMAEVGVSAESLRIGLGDLQKRLANPGFAKFYKQIGLTQNDLLRLDPAQQLDAVIQALRKVPDELLVGRAGGVLEEQSGKDFAKLVRDFQTYAQAIKDYNRIVGDGLTSRDAKSIEETGRQTRLLQLQWKVLKREIVLDAAPKLIAAFEEIEKAGTFELISDEIAGLIRDINTLIENVKWLAAGFTALKNAAKIPDWLKPHLARGRIGPRPQDFATMHLDAINRIRSFTERGTAPSGLRPSPRMDEARGSMIVHQNNRFVITDRGAIPAIDKGVKQAMDRIQRAP